MHRVCSFGRTQAAAGLGQNSDGELTLPSLRRLVVMSSEKTFIREKVLAFGQSLGVEVGEKYSFA